MIQLEDKWNEALKRLGEIVPDDILEIRWMVDAPAVPLPPKSDFAEWGTAPTIHDTIMIVRKNPHAYQTYKQR